MHFDKAAVALDEPSNVPAGRRIRRNGGADGNAPVFGGFTGHVPDPLDVEIPVLL